MAVDKLNVNKMTEHITRGARPNFFYVELTPPVGASAIFGDVSSINYFIKATDLPDTGVGTIDVNYMSHVIPYAGDPDHSHDHKFSVINEEDFGVRDMFQNWIKLIAHPKNGTQLKYTQYTGSATIYQLGGLGEIIKAVRLVGMFPVKNNKLALSWDDKNKIETFDVDVKFAYPEDIATDLTVRDIVTPIIDGIRLAAILATSV